MLQKLWRVWKKLSSRGEQGLIENFKKQITQYIPCLGQKKKD